MTPEEMYRIKESHQTLDAFFAQLDGPNDIFKQILIEELLKVIHEIAYGVNYPYHEGL